MTESNTIIQHLQVSVSRAQEDVKYWEREANRWRFVAEQYFRMWYNDISGTMVADEQVDHEMSMFYKENFEDN
jgi:hypothetical protein